MEVEATASKIGYNKAGESNLPKYDFYLNISYSLFYAFPEKPKGNC